MIDKPRTMRRQDGKCWLIDGVGNQVGEAWFVGESIPVRPSQCSPIEFWPRVFRWNQKPDETKSRPVQP